MHPIFLPPSPPEVCFTLFKKDRKSFALAESKRLYEIWKSRRAGQQREKAALYARAAKRLPEVVAAYEKALHEGAVRH